MLRIEGVGVRLDEHWLCAPQWFEVDASEIVALVGPSGSGKSTLLKVIAGLMEPSVGRVVHNDIDLCDVAAHRRRIGMVFQDHVLFNHLNVADNIAFGLRAAKWPKTKRNERVEELLALVHLEGRGSQRVTTLSGGEAQRVSIARALAPQPSLLLADEPLSSLDRDLRTALGGDLRQLLVATHTAAIVVTHDYDEASRIADRTIDIAVSPQQ
jgi:ABC-type Fe3+/spermidine/putrescine transport system ATPase subunit